MRSNAIIMAAGMASRFAPLSYEKPKALIEVKGEILIERQIRQLQEAGILEIIVIVGYKKEQFYYLKEKFGVHIVENKEYLTKNNHSSIYAAKDYLKNTYICSADNYFTKNPFKEMEEEAYYAAVYVDGETSEWCMQTDENDYISSVTVGGRDSWYMLGHAFWSSGFSEKFVAILEKEYPLSETKNMFWEDIFIRHIHELNMKIKKYSSNDIYEFDSLDELRQFDQTYIENTRSKILCELALKLGCVESAIVDINVVKNSNGEAIGFSFMIDKKKYRYLYEKKEEEEIR